MLESENQVWRFHKKNIGESFGRPLWIPAFEHVKESDRFTNTRHSRESGNLEAAVRHIGPFYCGNAATDSRFRGNDEVLLRLYFPAQGRFPGAPNVIMTVAQFPHTLFAERICPDNDKPDRIEALARSSRRRLATPPEVEPNRQPPSRDRTPKNPGLVQKSRYVCRRGSRFPCRNRGTLAAPSQKTGVSV